MFAWEGEKEKERRRKEERAEMEERVSKKKKCWEWEASGENFMTSEAVFYQKSLSKEIFKYLEMLPIKLTLQYSFI